MALFVSYAHDVEGERLTQFVVDELRARSYSVSWDRDQLNPSSIQEWMENQVADSIVICVVSKEYCERFGRGDDSRNHRGVLYESRAIELKLHDHTSPTDCPVIPVSLGAFSQDHLPPALRRLRVTPIDPVTHQGIDELVERIRELNELPSARAGGPVTVDTTSTDELTHMEPGTTEPEDRRLLRELESAEGGPGQGCEAVRAWLAYGERHPDAAATFFAQGFTHAERIVKAAGDLTLMRQLSEACLAAVNRSDQPLASDLRFRARVLVCGIGWCLQREHRLTEALISTLEGVELAHRVHDRLTEAFGKKCLGRLERLFAEDLRKPNDIRAHLENSIAYLDEARQMFAGIDGEDSEEVGACLSLKARTLLAYYRATRENSRLTEANEYAVAADSIIGPSNFKDYSDLVILRAEIDIEGHHYAPARGHLNVVIERLRALSGAQYSEILARALRVRGVLASTAPPKDITGALRDLEEAGQTFQKFAQPYAAAECAWQGVLINPPVTPTRLTRKDLDRLEAEEPDPGRRLRALQVVSEDEKHRVGRPVGRRAINWRAVLRRLNGNH
jgi:hypothetical protein